MKIQQLITEEKDLAAIYLKGVKQTGVLKSFKGNMTLSKGREDDIVTETVRLIKTGHMQKRALWMYLHQMKDSMKLQGDTHSLVHAVSSVKRIAGENAHYSVQPILDAAITLQNLIENYSTFYSGVYKCKQVLDELAGLAMKRYPLNTNPREVDEQVSFAATMTLKGLGVWPEYRAALADGGILI